MKAEKIAQVKKLVAKKELPPLNVKYIKDGVKLRPYQNLGATFLYYVKRCILADSCGLGKTPQTLVAYAIAKERDPDLRLLIICESSTLYQWADEVDKFLKDLTVQVIVTPPPHRRKGWPSTEGVRRYYYQMSDADIFVVSQKIFERDWHGDSICELAHDAMVVLDEATAAKNPKTLLHSAIKEASATANSLKLLTATPIYKGIEDYFNLMKIVDRTVFGYKKDFMREFCKTKNIRMKIGRQFKFVPKITGSKNEDKFHERCSHYVLRRTPVEVGEQLPHVIEKPISLIMSDAQARIYQAASEGKYNVLDEGKIDIYDDEEEIHRAQKLRVVSQQREQQAANHPELLGEKAGSVKLDKLISLLQGPLDGMKVLVYSRSRRTVDILEREIKKQLKKKVTRVTGKEAAKTRRDNQKKFWGKTDICLITNAAEKGVNLQCAAAFVFFDQPWTWGARNQLLGRICRIGSEHAKVLSILLMARDTVDEHVYKILGVGAETVEKTFGDKDLMKVTPFMLDTIVKIMKQGRTADEALLAFAEEHPEQFESFLGGAACG